MSSQKEQQIKIEAHSKEQLWFAKVKAEGVFQEIPYEISTSLQSDLNSIQFSDLKGRIPDGFFYGSLRYSIPEHICYGTLDTQNLQINSIAPYLSPNLFGTLYGKVNVSLILRGLQTNTNQLSQYAQININSQNIQYNDCYLSQGDFEAQFIALNQADLIFQTYIAGKARGVKCQDITIDLLQASGGLYLDLKNLSSPDFKIDWQAKQLQSAYGTMAQTHGQFIGTYETAITGQLQAWLQNIEAVEGHVDELIGTLSIDATKSQWPFSIDVNDKAINLHTEGFCYYWRDELALQINKLQGEIEKENINMRQTLSVKYKDQNIHLSNLDIEFGQTRIQGTFTKEKDEINAQLQASSFALQTLALFFPQLPVSGFVDAQLQLHGSVQSPQGLLKINFNELKIAKQILNHSPQLKGEMQLELSGNQVALTTSISGIGSKSIEMKGTLPLSFSLDPAGLHITDKKAWQVDLYSENELSALLNTFENDDTSLNGHVKIALSISGSPHNPQIQGAIDISGGSYETPTGALFTNIKAHLNAHGNKIILSEFSAQDQTKGLISANGQILLDSEQNYPFEIHISPIHLNLFDADYANLSASGKLLWSGNLKQSLLKGTLTVDEASVHLEESLPRQIKTVDVCYINVPQGAVPPTEEEAPIQNFVIDLDIQLQAPNGLVVTGRNMSSEWKGDIAISGNSTTPLFNGTLRIVRGDYKFNGKDFNLSQGSIHFIGKKTSLYIVASRDIEEIRVEIIVKGPIERPVISFRSNPLLSQREILSYILFNRGISDITKAEGDQLTQSFVALQASEDEGDDFLTRLRNNIGIDRLDFDADTASNELSLQVGKYITRNILVSINKSITDINNRIAIEANLRYNLKLKAEKDMSKNGQMRTSLKWKKDY